MTTPEELIGKLLLRHNCVVIPSFGGFVAQRVSATIDFTNGKMLPPRKSLLFNKQLVNNDGLLISELAQENNCSYDEASSEVEQMVAKWKQNLDQGLRIELDKIGYLFIDSEKNLQFEQDRFFNLLLDSFGLGSVQFVAEKEEVLVTSELENSETVEEIKEPILTVVQEPSAGKNETKVIEIQHPRKTKVWKYIAAACIVPIAFYSFWIPMKTDVLESGVVSISDFNPFHKHAEGNYKKIEFSGEEEVVASSSLDEQVNELPEDIEVYTYEFEPDFNIPVKVKEQSSDPDVEPEMISAEASHFIVGCFANESNATNLVSKMKSEGFDALIVDVHNGLHRVSAGAALSNESFNKIKESAQSMGYKGWTLK